MPTDKRHFSMRLSDDARVMIEDLAGRWEVSQTQVIEIAIRVVHAPPHPHEEELRSEWEQLTDQFGNMANQLNAFIKRYSDIHIPPNEKYLPTRSRPRRKKPGGNKNFTTTPDSSDSQVQ